MDNKNLKKISEELGIKLWQAEAAAELIDGGSTIPFIARYRKEATGSLNDEQADYHQHHRRAGQTDR